MSKISVSTLTFAYEGSYDYIFEDVSFQIDTNWRLGLIGRNGRGKTTFLKLLLGKYAYQGTISHSVQFDYFPFVVEDQTRETLTIVREIHPDYVYWELLRELSLLQVEEDVLYQPFQHLSNGQRTKVLLAVLFLKENHFLLIDEPTNHLDEHGRELVASYLSRKRGFILVSHDRRFLDHCIDHVLSINKTNIEVVQGNFSSWWQNKQLQDHFELAENAKLQKEIGRLSQAAKRSASWSDKVESSKFGVDKSGAKVADRGYVGHQSAKLMKRAKHQENRMHKALEEKSLLLNNIERVDSLKITQLDYPADRLVSLRDVVIAYHQKIICQHVSFTIEKGDRIALHGKNGSGKSSIIKLICGEPLAYCGELELGSKLQISLVSQETGFLKGDLRAFVQDNAIDETLFKTILRKLDFSREQFAKDMADFSEGQKKKVLLARSLCQQAHLYIWDEPLNFIDVISRMQLEELLLAFKPTILFVEHDQEFCRNIATKEIFLAADEA